MTVLLSFDMGDISKAKDRVHGVVDPATLDSAVSAPVRMQARSEKEVQAVGRASHVH